MSAAGDLSYEHAIRRSDAAAAACALFTRDRRRVYRDCLFMLRSPHDAEDAVQQAFVNALQALQAGVRPLNETAWLRQIARNICLERRRNAQRRARLETTTSPENIDWLASVPEISIDDQTADIRAALERLEPRQRQALVLREWRGLSYREIGSALQLSQSAVEALLFRARRSLSRALEDSKGLRRGLDLGGVLANLRALLTGSVAKTAAIVACCGTTIVGVPLLGHAITESPRPPAAAGLPGTTTPVAQAAGGERTRVAVATARRHGAAHPRFTQTGSVSAEPARGGAGPAGAGSPISTAADATPTGPSGRDGAPGPSGPAAASPDSPLGVPQARTRTETDKSAAIDIAVGGSTGVGAGVSANSSGSDTTATVTVSAPEGTSAAATVDVSGSQAGASASATGPAGTTASVAVDDSGVTVTASVPAAGVSTTIALPLPPLPLPPLP